ncbi:MAG: ferredoxin family protein [Anaerolineae bacterium]|jgi:NAD-dependent dihydropyrimidine dehydrogenase PreA subunit
MTHIITSLCLRDGACMEVCPVECIVPGKPEDQWPWYFIDPDTCIDCGACIPECPFEAIFIEEEVPSAYEMMEGQERLPFDTKTIVVHKEGDVVDLTPDIQYNYQFFSKGPGYEALNM